MQFFIESWAPEYGSAAEDMLAATTTEVDVTCEIAADAWAPLRPPSTTVDPACIAFVDGVRRVDARVWVQPSDGPLRQGVCATYAAGAVRCDGRATLASAIVERGVFCPGNGIDPIVTRHATYEPRPTQGEAPEQLWIAVQAQMALLEAKAAVAAGAGADADLVVVDGPLSERRSVPGVVGYVKTHHVRYLGPGHEETVADLRPGERTPVFLIGGRFPRWSWYVRLPMSLTAHPWGGIVRCEAPPSLPISEVRGLADTMALVLPRFASEPHKDPRAPQNLHPIAGLERELRRRLGDARLLERALRAAAAA
jgi:hypothetical protein